MRTYFVIATVLCVLSIAFHLTDRLFWKPAEDAMVEVNEIDFAMQDLRAMVTKLQRQQREDSVELFYKTERFGLLESCTMEGWQNDTAEMEIGLRYTEARVKLDDWYLRKGER